MMKTRERLSMVMGAAGLFMLIFMLIIFVEESTHFLRFLTIRFTPCNWSLFELIFKGGDRYFEIFGTPFYPYLIVLVLMEAGVVLLVLGMLLHCGMIGKEKEEIGEK